MNQMVLDIANKILLVIGTAFLSDAEAASLPSSPEKPEIYKTLFKILQDRKAPQSVFDKLKAKALLDGVDTPKSEATKLFGSNIVLGFGVD